VLGFVGFVLVVVVGIHLYLWKRLVRDTLRPGPWRKAGGFVVLALALFVPATLILVRGGYAEWLAWPGYLWIALMFYLLVILVLLEIPRLLVRLIWRTSRRAPEAEPAKQVAAARVDKEKRDGGAERPDGSDSAGGAPEQAGIDRRMLLARGAAIFAGLTAAGITGYGVRTALGGPRLDRVQIPLAKLPRAMDGTRLAVVSDIHLGPLTGPDHISRIVSMINSTDADVVCIVGDLVDGTVEELGAAAAGLRDIRARQGAYFVTGNHEYYSGFREWVDEVARLDIRPLRNERLEIATGRGVFDLAGVNDPGGADFGDAPDFARALGDRDTARPVVLMAHQPVVARDAARYGVDLQVSGHTHGGQMVPFNYLVGLQQPVVSGLGSVDGVPVYVTNGAGFWGPPVRVGAPPQVTLIELRAP
jgi:predicted MPP superfamily phosphohydrolase